MQFMLDTTICIDAIKRRPASVLSALRQHEAAGLGLSSITVAELEFGVWKSGSKRNVTALKQFLEPLTIAEFDALAAKSYGRLRAHLETMGQSIGPLDTLIAGHALSLGVTLVSNNTQEFARVPGLMLANWALSEPAG